MNSTLKITSTLFHELEKECILHCHWKSNQHLKEALTGSTDIDLLVDKKRAGESKSVLLKLGFKRVISQPWCRYPGLEDWIGYDAESGRLAHIHLHYSLLMGRKFVKELHLPIENLVLESAIKSVEYGVFIADPNLEILLLIIRICQKTSLNSILSGLIKKSLLPDNILKEFYYLRDRINDASVKNHAFKIFEKSIAIRLLNLIKEGSVEKTKDIFILKRLLKRTLKVYFRIPPHYVSLIYLSKKICSILTRLKHRFFFISPDKKNIDKKRNHYRICWM